jgi:hypothetical protein
LPRNKAKIGLNFMQVYEIMLAFEMATTHHQKGIAYEDNG